MPRTRRGFIYISATVLTATVAAVWLVSNPVQTVPLPTPTVTLNAVDEPRAGGETTQTATDIARRDPAAFFELARAKYHESVSAYRATLTKQERVQGELTEVQEVELRYRGEPLSIYMLWKKNPDTARRALYMNTPDFEDEDGQKLARVEPNGLPRLLVSDIMIQTRGPQAAKSSRHSIEDAGFASFFRMLQTYNAKARAAGTLKLEYAGQGDVDGRETIVIVRELPYTGPDGSYPDARLVMHFDQETLLPIAVYSYADHQEQKLLGRYIYTDIDLNPEFDENAFTF